MEKQVSSSYQHLPISLCMIIKNEERLIKKVLLSAQSIVSEMIVVDTGSTDQSIALAKEAGAKVYLHPWEGSFSIARNQALSYATQPWILILDGDELLDPYHIDLFKQIDFQSTPYQAFELLVVNYTTDRKIEEEAHFFWQVRLFRNLSKHRYDRNIHNQILDISTQQHLGGPRLNIKILHDGYTPSVWAQQKKDDRLKLLIQEIEKYPMDALSHFNLANHLKILKNEESALTHYLEVIALLKQKKPDDIHDILNGIHDQDWYQNAYYSAVFCANQCQRFELSLTLSAELMAHNPLLAEIILRRMEALMSLHRYAEAIALCDRFYLQRTHYASKQKTWIDLKYRYGRCLYLNGEYQRAFDAFITIYAISDDITLFNHIALLSIELNQPLTFALSIALIIEIDAQDPDLKTILQLFQAKYPDFKDCQNQEMLIQQLYAPSHIESIQQTQAQQNQLLEEEYLQKYQALIQRFQPLLQEADPLIELLLVGDHSDAWLSYQSLSPFTFHRYESKEKIMIDIKLDSTLFIFNLNSESPYFGELIYASSRTLADQLCQDISHGTTYELRNQPYILINPVASSSLSYSQIKHRLRGKNKLIFPQIHQFIPKNKYTQLLESIEQKGWSLKINQPLRALSSLYEGIEKILMNENN